MSSPVPLLETLVPPTRLVRTGPDSWFVDFGRAVFGTVEIALESPADGVEVVFHLGEKSAGPFTVDRNPGGTVRYRRATLRLDRGRQRRRVVIPPDARNTGERAIKMPPAIGEVLPFRYLEIEHAPGIIRPEDLRQVFVHAPFDDDAAHFESSDPVLNDVWRICKHTIKATTFCGLYVDGDRERIPYEGDVYVNQLSHYCVDAAGALPIARASHEYLLSNATWPTEWLLHSVLIAWYDYLYSGDAASLRAHYESLRLRCLVDLAGEDGLISTCTGLVTDALKRAVGFPEPVAEREIRDIVDWPQRGFAGPDVPGEADDHVFTEINTVVNALHQRALQLMARMAAVAGRDDDAAHFRQRARAQADAFNARLFDPAQGVYVDGVGTSHASQHSNFFPLMAGLVPPERRASVVAHVKSRGMACSVYGAQHLLDGLYLAGEAEHALALMTARDERSWAYMIYELRTTMTAEAWGPRFKPNLDWNHAWGAAPANVIVRRLLGVRPAEPGFRRAIVAPQPGGLRWASARIPTPHGPIDMELETRRDGSPAWRCSPPDGVEIVGSMPTPS